jgi:restriction system protein
MATKHKIADVKELSRVDHETIFRAEELESAILDLRVAIGSLPDRKMGQFILMDAAKAIHEDGGSPIKINEAYHKVAESGKYKTLTDEAIEEIATASGEKELHVVQFALAWDEMRRRRVNLYYPRSQRKAWDGTINLDQLFTGEHIPTDPTAYLDQRYIDYLAKNSEEMGHMHWRNFERLTGEFFRRQGYEVDLGKGIKDGGVDVRVWTDKEAKIGPPMLMIQCKRTKDVVGIETVKAFWTDVEFEEAELGLIATTSTVSRDSRKICDVRKWPMKFAEGEQIRKWARSMWRNRPKAR